MVDIVGLKKVRICDTIIEGIIREKWKIHADCKVAIDQVVIEGFEVMKHR